MPAGVCVGGGGMLCLLAAGHLRVKPPALLTVCVGSSLIAGCVLCAPGDRKSLTVSDRPLQQHSMLIPGRRSCLAAPIPCLLSTLLTCACDCLPRCFPTPVQVA